MLAASNNAELRSTGDVQNVAAAADVDSQNELVDLSDLVRCFGQRVQRLCFSLTGEASESVDLAQDVFVIAIEKRQSFRGDSSVETWLLGIAVRVCRNWNRRRAIRRRAFGMFAMSRDDAATDTSVQIARREEILQGLQAIDFKSREALVLRYFEDRKIEELQVILNLSRAGVDQRLSRARRKLATWLEGQR